MFFFFFFASLFLWLERLKGIIGRGHDLRLSCDVFTCLFALDLQNEIQQLSTFFCYSWLACLLGCG